MTFLIIHSQLSKGTLSFWGKQKWGDIEETHKRGAAQFSWIQMDLVSVWDDVAISNFTCHYPHK